MFFSIFYCANCLLRDLLTRHLQLILHMNVRSCYESMNVFQVTFDSTINVDLTCASKAKNFSLQSLLYYRLDRLHLTMRYYWKPCLYCIDPKFLKSDRDLNLLVWCYRYARCLLAVPESSIKDLDTFSVIQYFSRRVQLSTPPLGRAETPVLDNCAIP